MPRILLVDDEVEIVRVLERFLQRNGFDTVSAVGGKDALEILHSDGAIDLLVLDIKMPDVSGMDILEDIKKSGSKIPVLILSGSIGAPETMTSLRRFGYTEDDVLYKPSDLNEILKAIKRKLRPLNPAE